MSSPDASPLGGEALQAAISSLSTKIAPPTFDAPGPGIGLTGCGEISAMHLGAYKRLGLNVSALCSRDISKAESRALEFFPEAGVFGSHAELLEQADVGVVDVATHPEGRASMIMAALESGMHVLSQKPFVLSIPLGQELLAAAESRGLSLAVNQNGRWAPHLAAIRESVRAGLVGAVEEIDVAISWDHSWTVGTAFDRTPHLVLFDFGIHWFDFVVSLLGEREVEQVSSSVEFSPGQASPQPMRASVQMLGHGLRVTMSFDGDNRESPRDTTRVSGADGTLSAAGPDLSEQELSLTRGGEIMEIPLSGSWFTTGFEGSMCELLAAIQESREPLHGARENLRSLELAFAACASANSGEPVRPGDVQAFPGSL